eukprot:CAMPEP_0179896004 /NCGR_PEP_ID=MMETSP0982-20121206/36144_1 /TAXON_ID=483367 /ORGANISM="non described non described, Strain CCMP 2436" /LENGTH=101 /DNA_ID=CAMNT_0021792745 /DNA_START=455 /DNA_END=761 /DNA_ORIENTATION=-
MSKAADTLITRLPHPPPRRASRFGNGRIAVSLATVARGPTGMFVFVVARVHPAKLEAGDLLLVSPPPLILLLVGHDQVDHDDEEPNHDEDEGDDQPVGWAL